MFRIRRALKMRLQDIERSGRDALPAIGMQAKGLDNR
jgi:hypothetical protein